jgi:hypothetical protein
MQMKLFAINLLAEHLDRQTFVTLDPRDVECKCLRPRSENFMLGCLIAKLNLDFTKTLCYIIQREIDLVSHPDLNFKALAKDGILGK